MTSPDTRLVKVVVPTEDGGTESLWAAPQGSGRYRLDNLLFVAFGLSLGDIVLAKQVGGELLLDRVVERSGHSTYRLALQDAVEPDDFPQLCEPLTALGCGLERFTRRMMGVDVPPTVDLDRVYAIIAAGMDAGTWWFDEVHVGHGVT